MRFKARGRAERNKKLWVIFFLRTRQWLFRSSQRAVWWCRLIRLARAGRSLQAASSCIQAPQWMLENQANFLIFTRGDEADDILYWWHHASLQMWTERKESIRWIFHHKPVKSSILRGNTMLRISTPWGFTKWRAKGSKAKPCAPPGSGNREQIL